MSNVIVKNKEELLVVSTKKTAIKVKSTSQDLVISPKITKIAVKEKIAENIVINANPVIVSNTADLLMNCSESESVGDAVYIFADGEVRKSSNSSILTAKVIGFIINKPSTTSCGIRTFGVISQFLNLTVGQQYFLSLAGGISSVPPILADSVLVRVGHAITSTTLLININNNYIIRS